MLSLWRARVFLTRDQMIPDRDATFCSRPIKFSYGTARSGSRVPTYSWTNFTTAFEYWMKQQRRAEMKKLLLAGVAALLVLSASAACAEGWEVDCRRNR